MKTNIYYFSGTKNTYKVAETLNSALIALDVESELFNVEKCPSHTPCDTIVIAYPVWGFGEPSIVKDFVKRLPNGSGKVYFLKTSGEPLSLNNASSIALAKIMERKGYLVSGEYHYIMPYNMVFRHDDQLASKMFKVAKERLLSTANDIKNGIVTPIHFPVTARFMRAVCSIEHVGMRLNGALYSVKKDRCINCNKCLNNCPTKNITIREGKYRFGGNCLGCARCAFNCPTNAIHTGILNFLKVNGPYDFSLTDENPTIPNYCKKSYEKYFNVENSKH